VSTERDAKQTLDAIAAAKPATENCSSVKEESATPPATGSSERYLGSETACNGSGEQLDSALRAAVWRRGGRRGTWRRMAKVRAAVKRHSHALMV